MRTFVLSGGGNRGPLEVGALQALLENGIAPEMVVGSSAGALNGALLAADPSPAQMARLADVWREAARNRVLRASPLSIIWRLLRGSAHFMDNSRMVELVRREIPPGRQHFGDLPVPLYVTIAHLVSHTLYVYGDDPAASIADAIITSAAVPGYLPPLVHNGETYVDGGVVSDLPVRLAIARGAIEIWAVDLAYSMDKPRKTSSALMNMALSLAPMLYDESLRELESCIGAPGVTLHHIPIYASQDVMLGDFSATESMFAEGARAVREYLSKPEPNVIHYPHRLCERELPAGPPGARPFITQ